MSLEEKVAEVAASALAPGEVVVVAAKALPAGGLKAAQRRGVATGLGGVLGAVVAGGGKGAGPQPIELPTASHMAVGLTDRQLLVTKLGAMGSPKELVGSVPLTDITGATWIKGRTGAVKTGHLELGLANGGLGRLEFARPAFAAGESLAAAINERVAPAG